MNICYISNSAAPSKNASSLQTAKLCEALSKIDTKLIWCYLIQDTKVKIIIIFMTLKVSSKLKELNILKISYRCELLFIFFILYIDL